MKCPVYTVQLVRQRSVDYVRERCNSTDTALRVVGQLVEPLLANSPHEQFLIVTLDTKLKPIGVHAVTAGTLDASLVHPREVFRHALLANAGSILLVHNHPSGDLDPSREDYAVTERLKKCGDILGITVLDSLIFGTNDSGEFKGISMAEYNLCKNTGQ